MLVDTPGVNDLNEQRAEVTYGYVPRADAVVFLLDAGQALKDSEREFLRSRVLESARDRLIFVLGKMDMLSADERTAVVDYVKTGLAKMTPRSGGVPAVGEGLGAQSKDPDSGMPELMAYLERFLARDRAQVILDNAAADAARTAAYLENNLGVRMHAYDLDIGELEQRIAPCASSSTPRKRKLDELHVRIDADAESIKTRSGSISRRSRRRSSRRCRRRSTRSTPTTSRRYLPAFIEDKFKEWAELEGAKLAAMLEHLAEEVISITNENVAAAAGALAERLGPERHRGRDLGR